MMKGRQASAGITVQHSTTSKIPSRDFNSGTFLVTIAGETKTKPSEMVTRNGSQKSFSPPSLKRIETVSGTRKVAENTRRINPKLGKIRRRMSML
jgi:hypothetical protein